MTDLPDDFDAYYSQLLEQFVPTNGTPKPIDPPASEPTATVERVEETKPALDEFEYEPLDELLAELPNPEPQVPTDVKPLEPVQVGPQPENWSEVIEAIEEFGNEPTTIKDDDKELLRDLSSEVIAFLIDHPDKTADEFWKMTKGQPFRDDEGFIFSLINSYHDEHGVVPTRPILREMVGKAIVINTEQDAIRGNRLLALLDRKSDPREVPFIQQQLTRIVQPWLERRHRLSLATKVMEISRAIEDSESVDFTTTITAMCDDLRALAAGTGRKERFKIIDSDEFDANSYELVYLIPGVLVKDQPAVIAGPKKGLKTTISIDLAVALAKGGYFLGKWKVPQRQRVLVISAESGNATLKDTARRVCRAAKCQLRDLNGWLLWAEDAAVPKLQDDMDMAEFVRVLQRIKPGVVILDPLYKMHSGDGAESIYKMGGPLERLGRACLDNGATPVVLHHLKSIRGNPFDPADLDDMSYAGCAEYFRQWILVNRRAKYEPNSGHHEMWLTIGGSAGHSSEWSLDVEEGIIADEGGRRWETSFLRSDEAREVAKVEKVKAKEAEEQGKLVKWKEQVLAFIKLLPEGRTQRQIGRYSGAPERKAFEILTELQADGLIEPTMVRTGNNNREYDGWKLRTVATSTATSRPLSRQSSPLSP